MIIARKVISRLKDNFCIMLCLLFIDVYFKKSEDRLEFFLFVYYNIQLCYVSVTDENEGL